ncbi:MAG: penicillin-binding protein [Candidatus Levybacteria bacterium]|nr:penicillin-binding protein [Candidatus Levybacteria bacterium]MBI2420567.1 penicillin-binding protein [Candidatus Levybacteria bacterium]
MVFITGLLVILIKILITIGDSVIRVLTFFLKIIKSSFGFFVYFFQNLKQRTTVLKKRSEVIIYKTKRPKTSIPRPSIAFNLSFPKLRLNLPIFRKRKRGRKPNISFFFKLKYLLAGILISFFLVFLPLISIIIFQTLPSPRELIYQEVAQTTKIYDRNGKLLYQIYANQNRTLITLSEIPINLKNATIAIEDKNFYSTPGFDIFAILRSAMADLSGEPLQGGSTITQQLIKTRLLSPERTIERKVKEIILAVWAERIYSKNQILEMYLNQVPYGGTAWGIEAAAQTYFGKNAKDLDLAESAFLAGLPQSPSIYSPYGERPLLWKTRQREVLRRMIDLGFITKDQAQKADREKLSFLPPQHILHAPHFVMYVKDLLIKKYGINMVERGGLNVITSLDLEKQRTAEKMVKEEVEAGVGLNFTNGAALITNPKNGDVLAMVGGKDYFNDTSGNFNVTTALRQPGSTIKAVTYTAALMNGFTAATVIADTPVRFDSPGAPPYIPVNYDGRFHGNLSLRESLGNSINVSAVKTLNKIGVPTMMDLAKRMGITSWGSPDQYGLAITLGAVEVKMTDMAVVFGTLANQGERVDLNPVLKITDYKGNTLEEKISTPARRVIPKEIAFIIANILSDNRARAIEFGLNSPLVIPGHNVSVKTGTTDNKRDNWTIGFTPSYLTAVWVGNNDNSPMNPTLASGITGAAPIWNKIMSNLLAGKPNEGYQPPENIVQKPCQGRNEYFVRGTESSAPCRPISRNEISPTPRP